MIGDYTTSKTLGTGAFGTVKLAKKNGSDVLYAIKSISKQSILRSQMGSQVKKEISIMKSLDHPNVVQIYEVLMSTEYLYIVMDFVSGGELYNKITRAGKLSDGDCRRYVRQLCSALNYCHTRNVCHRDIKPQNILLDSNDNVLLADFGFASIMEVDVEAEVLVEPRRTLRSFSGNSASQLDVGGDSDEGRRTMEGSSRVMKAMSTMCGTMMYMAPEISNREKYFGDKADIWSLGVVIYVLLVGFMPFKEEDTAKDKFVFPKHVGREASDFVSKMLILEPGERFSARRLLEHPWISNQVESVRLTKESSDSYSDDTSEEEVASLDFSVRIDGCKVGDEKLLEGIGSVMVKEGWKTRGIVKDGKNSMNASRMSRNGIVMVAVEAKDNVVSVRHANLTRDANAVEMKELEALIGKTIV